MLLKFTNLELQPIFPYNTRFRLDIFKSDEVTDILVWVGLPQVARLTILACDMQYAISRYCETRPKIIDYILFVGIRDVDHLKERLVEELARFDQKIIDGLINQWRKRLRACMSADDGHFEQTI